MSEIFKFFQNEQNYPDLDIEKAAKALSRAVQCKTVSDCEDPQPFYDLHEVIKSSFPNVMANGTFETVDRSVLITVPGSDPSLKPALFMSHLDVVPVVRGTEKDWTYDAYSGHIDENYIWGRGTQDIKVQVFGELEACEYLLAHGKKPKRTIYLAFGQNEETFNTGAQSLSDLLKSRGVTLEFLLDEGGGSIEKGDRYGAPDTYISTIDLMEKGYADLKLTFESKGGHSSRPFGGTSLGNLSRAIAKIVENPYPVELCDTLKATFRAVQPYVTVEPLKTLLTDIDANEEAIAKFCYENPDFFPFVTTTIAPTMIAGSSDAPNVMPQTMSAVINFRIAAGWDPEKIMEHCKELVNDDRIKMEFLQSNPSSGQARADGYGFAKVREALETYFKDVVFVPGITIGGTDAHCYEQICDTCLRYSPMAAPAEDHGGVHGTNERILIRAFAQGIRVLITLMENTCM